MSQYNKFIASVSSLLGVKKTKEETAMKLLLCLATVLVLSHANPFDRLTRATAAAVSPPPSRSETTTTDSQFDVQGIPLNCGNCRGSGCRGCQTLVPGPRGLTGASGPGAVIPFASGIFDPSLSGTVNIGTVWNLGFGSSSPEIIGGQLSAFEETAFAFSSPRSGLLRNLTINSQAFLNETLVPGNTNSTITAVIRKSSEGSPFVNTALQASFTIPAGTLTSTHFYAADLTDVVTVAQGDQYTLQIVFNNTVVTVPSTLFISISAGLVYS